jgi:hypothetical protein
VAVVVQQGGDHQAVGCPIQRRPLRRLQGVFALADIFAVEPVAEAVEGRQDVIDAHPAYSR